MPRDLARETGLPGYQKEVVLTLPYALRMNDTRQLSTLLDVTDYLRFSGQANGGGVARAGARLHLSGQMNGRLTIEKAHIRIFLVSSTALRKYWEPSMSRVGSTGSSS